MKSHPGSDVARRVPTTPGDAGRVSLARRSQAKAAGPGGRLARSKWLPFAAIALITLPSTKLVHAQGVLYFVNTTSDTVVAGACESGAAGCSLRGAIQAANSHPGEDEIEIALPAGSVINLTQALPDLTDGLSIVGPGADGLTVRRDTGGAYSIFKVTTTEGVSFSGFTIRNGTGGINSVSTATVNVTNCLIAGNNGAGIINQGAGTLNVTNSTISDSDSGGGIYNTASNLNVTNSTISGNSGSSGGIFNAGTLNVTNSTVSGNSVTGQPGQPELGVPGIPAQGGGIYNAGTGTIANSTISGNSATGAVGEFTGDHRLAEGGGIYNETSTTLAVTNSTLSGNSANGSSGNNGGGGGIYNRLGTINISNSTFSGNNANATGTGNGFGGGIFNGIHPSGTPGTVNVKSSIIANNTATSGPDVSAVSPFTSQGFNLIGKNNGAAASFPAGNPNANNDIVGTSASPVDPKLDPNGLQNNGGPTQTIALQPGSRALDKGTSNGLTGNLSTDQRGAGFSRTFDEPSIANAAGGDGTDVGAFEVGPPVPLNSVVSRKVHGTTPFDINLPLTGNPGVECRSGGASGVYKLIFSFANTLMSVGNASVTSGTGSVSSHTIGANTHNYIVNLTGVSNAQVIRVRLTNVNDSAGNSSSSVPISLGVLIGDSTGNGSVNSSDIGQTKSKSGQTASASNFRTDVTVSGSINSSDIGLVKSKSGTALP